MAKTISEEEEIMYMQEKTWPTIMEEDKKANKIRN